MEGRISGGERKNREMTREGRGEERRGEERRGKEINGEQRKTEAYTHIIHAENTETNTLHNKASFVFPSSTVSVVQQQYHQRRMTNIETNITYIYQNYVFEIATGIF